MIVNRSPATSFTPTADRSDAGDQQVSFVDLSEQRLVVHDIPDAVGDLFETNVLVPQRLTEEWLSRVEPELPAVLTRRTSMCAGYSGAVTHLR